MTDDDEEFLTTLYRSLDLRVLPAGDPQYVPFVEDGRAGGEDVVKSFGRQISRSAGGSAFFLTGTRGTGKSTQLRRLQHNLAAKGFVPLWLEAEDYVNLQAPIDVVEFLFFLAGGVSDAAARDSLLPAQTQAARGWNRLRDWLRNLPKRIEVEGVDLSATIGFSELISTDIGIKAAIRKDESFVAQLRRFLEGRVGELVEQVKLLIGDLVGQIRDQWAITRSDPFQGVVLLIDSIDHARGTDFKANRRALTDLFDKQLDSIRLRDCRTVFVIPPHLHVEFGTKRTLTNVVVTKRDGSSVLPGREALAEMISRRFGGSPITRLFADDAVLDRLIELSGGHLRDLLRLVQEVSVLTDHLPADPGAVEDAIKHVRQGLLSLSDDEKAALRKVRDSGALPLDDQDSWAPVASLFDRHLILSYQNGEVWYGVHPLIAEVIPAAP